MGAPGAGAPMKFPSGTHTKSHFALKWFSIDIRAPVYQNYLLPTPMKYSMPISYLQIGMYAWYFEGWILLL